MLPRPRKEETRVLGTFAGRPRPEYETVFCVSNFLDGGAQSQSPTASGGVRILHLFPCFADALLFSQVPTLESTYEQIARFLSQPPHRWTQI